MLIAHSILPTILCNFNFNILFNIYNYKLKQIHFLITVESSQSLNLFFKILKYDENKKYIY